MPNHMLEDAREVNPTWRSLLKTDVVGRSWEKGTAATRAGLMAGQASEIAPLKFASMCTGPRPPPAKLLKYKRKIELQKAEGDCASYLASCWLAGLRAYTQRFTLGN
jgi:hypothetical protein